MFGKPHDIDDTDTLDASAIDEFFGDEAAAANAVEVHELQHRVEQVEAQITSQFTSLATYAQIAQEQVELARSEAKAATERSEQRVTSLVERERADRITSFTGQAPAGSAPDIAARIDAVEQSVAQIRKALDGCLERQKSLAEAISLMFERMAPTAQPSPAEPIETPDVEDSVAVEGFDACPPAHADDEPMLDQPSLLAPPSLPAPVLQPPSGAPIADLSLND